MIASVPKMPVHDAEVSLSGLWLKLACKRELRDASCRGVQRQVAAGPAHFCQLLKITMRTCCTLLMFVSTKLMGGFPFLQVPSAPATEMARVV